MTDKITSDTLNIFNKSQVEHRATQALDTTSVDVIHNYTKIMYTDEHASLLNTFLEAHNIKEYVNIRKYRLILDTDERVSNNCIEHYYNAIDVVYSVTDDFSPIILLNLSANHNGLESMLADYLRKTSSDSTQVIPTGLYVRPATSTDVNNHYKTNVLPKLNSTKSKYVKRQAV